MNYKCKNWPSLQSYKDRKPPWIRLHKTLLDNYEFQMMSAESKAMLPMLWLLASEDDDPRSGIIKYSTEQIAFRLRVSQKAVTDSMQEIEKAGFIKRCNETVTESLRNRNENVTPETETEERQRREETDMYRIIFEHWNSCGIVSHRKLTDKMKTKIRSALKDYSIEEIKTAITTYAEILHGKQYYWSHKWTLEDFMARGVGKFVDPAIARDNYRQKTKPGEAKLPEPHRFN